MPLRALKEAQDCQVSFPDDERTDFLKDGVRERHDALVSAHCVADGLKPPFESWDGLTDQSVHCNGWLHGHHITNLFVFAADGHTIHAVTNVPGSVHDSVLAVWGGTHKRLKETCERTGGQSVLCGFSLCFWQSTLPNSFRRRHLRCQQCKGDGGIAANHLTETSDRAGNESHARLNAQVT